MPSATFCSSNEASNLNGIDKFSNTVYEVVPLSVTTVSVKFALSVYILYFKFFCPLPYFFEPDELLARVKAVLRRSDTKESNAEKEIVFPNLTINLSNYELKINGNIVEVPPKELELLYFLASNPNRVFTREQLLEEVWGFDYFGDSRTVDVHIKRLREKLEGVEANWQLKTVWGVGYKFEVR